MKSERVHLEVLSDGQHELSVVQLSNPDRLESALCNGGDVHVLDSHWGRVDLDELLPELRAECEQLLSLKARLSGRAGL